ncbi:ATP-binding protein [Telluribacter sp. SYSU D00476]|uniref:PAS domain-containing sensor histidine kinase n=1 Tax=Telluribacter sp. SYSU D00476 TaxID=2811430 RepID=UPI001FF47FF5|nr:ATP-binding protein [Telluribacter sp. SYSU D00476]
MLVASNKIQDFYNQLIEGSSDGLLVCTRKERGGEAEFEICAVNQQARTLLTWPTQVMTPVPIEQVVSASCLRETLADAHLSRTRKSGVLEQSFTNHSKSWLNYEVNPYGEALVVRLDKCSSTESREAQITQAIGQHIQETNLTCIIIFEAVRNEAGKIDNLRLTYQNEAAKNNRALGVVPQVDWLVTDWYPNTKTTGHFSKYVEVIETGVPYAAEQYYPAYDQSFHVAVSKCGDGIIMSYYSITEKQKAIRQTQQQAQLLQQIMNSSHDFIMLWEPVRGADGQVVDFKAVQYNQAVVNAGLFSADDFNKYTLTQLSPESRHFIPLYSQVLETGEPFRLEQPFRKGELNLWFDLSVTRLNDGALSIFKDITERKRATLRIQSHNSLLENVLNSSENAILVAESMRDQAGVIVDFMITKANKTAQKYLEQMFGCDVVGSSFMNLSQGKLELFMDFVEVAESGKPIVYEQRYYPQIDKWFKVSAHRLENGIVINYVDVTAIHTSLVNAQSQTELVQGVLDGSINGIFAMEPIRDARGQVEDFRVLLANAGASRIIGLPCDRLAGSSLISLFPDIAETGFFDIYHNAVLNDSPFRSELAFPGADGKQFWYDVSLTLVNHNMVILSFVNITDRVQLRQRQEKLLEELRHSNLYLEQFAYVASHDLQEPARKIQSFGDILERQYGSLLPKQGVDIINRMRSAGSRMQDLIEGLLSYSRYSSQKEAHKTVVLDQVINNVMQDLEGVIEQKGAIVHISKLPVVTGSAVQLRQLFQNLLSNALKFCKDDTLPEISIEAGPATEEEINATVKCMDRRWYAIRVKDNGIGFDDTYRDRVFELFVRLHGRSQFVGSGLGLAISKKVAELHGGGITVKSSIGQGATFIVVLPSQEKA